MKELNELLNEITRYMDVADVITAHEQFKACWEKDVFSNWRNFLDALDATFTLMTKILNAGEKAEQAGSLIICTGMDKLKAAVEWMKFNLKLPMIINWNWIKTRVFRFLVSFTVTVINKLKGKGNWEGKDI